jgi:hypothetical protein
MANSIGPRERCFGRRSRLLRVDCETTTTRAAGFSAGSGCGAGGETGTASMIAASDPDSRAASGLSRW